MTGSEIAKTIQAQIGSRAFMMLGAKDLRVVDNGLQFRIRGSKTANFIHVKLTPADTYTIEFWKIRGTSLTKVSEVEDVYADSLNRTIEMHTGLYMSLGVAS